MPIYVIKKNKPKKIIRNIINRHIDLSTSQNQRFICVIKNIFTCTLEQSVSLHKETRHHHCVRVMNVWFCSFFCFAWMSQLQSLYDF